MTTCSTVIKRCGLEGTSQVADLNGVSARTIQLAFNVNEGIKFYDYVMAAVEELHRIAKEEAIAGLVDLWGEEHE